VKKSFLGVNFSGTTKVEQLFLKRKIENEIGHSLLIKKHFFHSSLIKIRVRVCFQNKLDCAWLIHAQLRLKLLSSQTKKLTVKTYTVNSYIEHYSELSCNAIMSMVMQKKLFKIITTSKSNTGIHYYKFIKSRQGISS